MIGAIVILTGILLFWVGFTNRGKAAWQAIFQTAFTPLGFGS